MSRSQIYKTSPRKCSRCLYKSHLTEKVSERLWPPAGGYLCPACLVPAAIDALNRIKEQPEEAPERSVRNREPHRSENFDPYLYEQQRKAEGRSKVQASITCPECNLTSYNKNDIKQGYCGNCNWWTSDDLLKLVPKEDRV